MATAIRTLVGLELLLPSSCQKVTFPTSTARTASAIRAESSFSLQQFNINSQSNNVAFFMRKCRRCQVPG